MLIGDNRDRGNLGCRATSIALSELLRDHLDVETVVDGRLVERPRPGSSLPASGLTRRVAQRAARSTLGWRGTRALPVALRPDVVMAPPSEVASAFLQLADDDPEIARLVAQVQRASTVVINGEGDLILTDPPRRKLVFLLAMIELAHRLDTPCAYVNAMVSDPPRGPRNDEVAGWARAALGRCALLAVRDDSSLALARELDLHPDPTWIPDALFSWHDRIPLEAKDDPVSRQGWPFEGRRFFDEDEPYICVSGGSAFGSDLPPPIEGYVRLVQKLGALGPQVVLVESAEADGFLRDVAARTGAAIVPWATNIYVTASILGRSRLFVSGRHHPTILAALGGSPPVMIGSNSHKNVSLQELLEVDDPAEADASLQGPVIDDLCRQAAQVLDEFDESSRAELRRRCSKLAGAARRLPDAILASLG